MTTTRRLRLVYFSMKYKAASNFPAAKGLCFPPLQSVLSTYEYAVLEKGWHIVFTSFFVDTYNLADVWLNPAVTWLRSAVHLCWVLKNNEKERTRPCGVPSLFIECFDSGFPSQGSAVVSQAHPRSCCRRLLLHGAAMALQASTL